MHSHTPKDYICPICETAQGKESDQTWIKQADIVYSTDNAMAFIGSKFVDGHEGYPLVVPKPHIENIYSMPDDLAAEIAIATAKIARAVRETYGCEGITIVQNNEPAGNQHAFHYHVHIVPRYYNDKFHEAFLRGKKSEPEERIKYAQRLRDYLGK